MKVTAFPDYDFYGHVAVERRMKGLVVCTSFIRSREGSPRLVCTLKDFFEIAINDLPG